MNIFPDSFPVTSQKARRRGRLFYEYTVIGDEAKTMKGATVRLSDAYVLHERRGVLAIPVVASHGTTEWMDENALVPEIVAGNRSVLFGDLGYYWDAASNASTSSSRPRDRSAS